MKYFVLPVLIGSLLLLGPPAARAVPLPGQMNRMGYATAVLCQMEAMIPPYVLRHARGIAVIPGAIKGEFGFGVASGYGVLVVRLSDGRWSAPSFISFIGAKTDVRFGGKVRNVVLILNTPGAVAAAENGTLYPGVGESVTTGPLGAVFCANTVIPPVYSYVGSAGGLVGATVKASRLAMDCGANWDIYGVANPLGMPGSEALTPWAARNFDCAVARATGAPTGVCGLS